MVACRSMLALVTATLAVGAPDDGPCIVDCPPGAVVEGEECNFGSGGVDTLNAGCRGDGPGPPSGGFTNLSCGETLCGTAYFDGNHWDQDWIEVTWDGDPGLVTMRVTAEFDVKVVRPVHVGPWNPECEFFSTSRASAPACTDARLRHLSSLSPGGTWYVIFTFDEIVDCAGDGFRYTATVECAPPDACNLDIDGEPGLGFGDLLVVLADWGFCSYCGPGDLNGDSRIDLEDLLLVLAYWGPCEVG